MENKNQIKPEAAAEVKVLLVEDEPINLVLLNEYVSTAGCLADVAIDGAVAIEKLSQDSFSVVITDIVMPNIDGFQLLRHIKKNYPAIKVIVVSAYTEKYTPESIFDAGAFEYLAKPYSSAEFIAALERAITR